MDVSGKENSILLIDILYALQKYTIKNDKCFSIKKKIRYNYCEIYSNLFLVTQYSAKISLHLKFSGTNIFSN